MRIIAGLSRCLRGLAGAVLAALALVPAAHAGGAVELPVILPLSGSAAFTGIGTRDTLSVVEATVNAQGGIAGRPVHFVLHDDQTSPQVAVQLVGQVLGAHPPVILGSTITAMCNAEAPLVAQGPVMYCYSPGIHPAAGGWVYSGTISTLDLSRVLIRFFRLKGWTRIAVMTSTDASGQDAERGIAANLGLPENRSIEIVDREHVNPGDVSVAAHIDNVKSAHPQAFIAWTTGTAVATIFKAMIQEGLDVPVGTTNGNMSRAQMLQYAAFAPKRLYIPSGPYTEHAGIGRLDPRVEAAQQAFYAAIKPHGLAVDNNSATAWDATMIVLSGLRKLGPDATAGQLRDYINGLTDYPGIWGIYNYRAVPQRGLGEANAVVTRWMPATGRFDWASRPGGKPLPGP